MTVTSSAAFQIPAAPERRGREGVRALAGEKA